MKKDISNMFCFKNASLQFKFFQTKKIHKHDYTMKFESEMNALNRPYNHVAASYRKCHTGDINEVTVSHISLSSESNEFGPHFTLNSHFLFLSVELIHVYVLIGLNNSLLRKCIQHRVVACFSSRFPNHNIAQFKLFSEEKNPTN